MLDFQLDPTFKLLFLNVEYNIKKVWSLRALLNVDSTFEFLECTGYRKNTTLTINDFKKTRDRINKPCPLLRIKFFFQQDDTKIIKFDEGVWIQWLFFWSNGIFKICHLCLKSHDWRAENFHCLAPPGKKCLLLLCKNEDSTNKEKRSNHYVILQCYNPGKALKEIPHYLNRDRFLIQKKQILKMTLLQKMALESKRLHQIHWSWCHFPGRRNFYAFMHSLILI